MATPGPSPSKLVEDSDTAVAPQPSGNQQALEMEDVIEFVEPLPNELQCPLCLEFLKEPTLTSCCGHHFCRECIDRAIARSIVCPLCNDQGFQTLINKEKQRLVSALKVYCKRKSQGCEWVGELGRLEHHLDVEEGDCGCVEVECEFGPVGCVAKLPRKDLRRHKEENVHKHLVLMSVMSLKSNEAFVKELREQRVEFQKQLKQKEEDIQAIQLSLQQQVDVSQELRGQLQQKDQQIADIRDELLQRGEQIATIQQTMEGKQQLISNLERQLKGEAERLTRVAADVAENAQQFVKVERRLQDKLEQMESSFGEEQDQVKEKLEANENRLDGVERKQQEEKLEITRRLAEIDKMVEEKGEEQLETSLAEDQGQALAANGREEKLGEQLIPPFDIAMTDFEQHKKDCEDWFSPPFYSHTGGYKMCLRVIAKGRGRGEGTHVSVSVHLMCGEHDDYLKWPFNGCITVRLLNQRREEKNFGVFIYFNHRSGYEASSRVVGRERAMVGSGSSLFIAHSALGYNSAENTEYLRNDCLKFRVASIKLTNL